jgi:hypothetical protein
MGTVHHEGERPPGHEKEKQKDLEKQNQNYLRAEVLEDQHVSWPAQNEKETWV